MDWIRARYFRTTRSEVHGVLPGVHGVSPGVSPGVQGAFIKTTIVGLFVACLVLVCFNSIASPAGALEVNTSHLVAPQVSPKLTSPSAAWNPTSINLSNGSNDVSIESISCVNGVAFCMALGESFDINFNSSLLAYDFNGSVWQSTNISLPGSGLIESGNVSCYSATFCLAVGNEIINNSTVPFYSTFNGANWTSAGLPSDSGQSRLTAGDVSCTAPQSCILVGSYSPSSNPANVYPLIDSYDGASWTQVTSPQEPAGSALNSISCPSVNFCAAVGAINLSSPLIEVYSGTSWTTETSVYNPISSGSTTQNMDFSSVSCPSSSYCMAVGFYGSTLAQGGGSPFAEEYSGSGWSNAGLSSPESSSSVIMTSVDCLSSTNCYAVGDYMPSFSNSGTLQSAPWPEIADFNGSTWAQSIFNLPIGSSSGGIGQVSCSGPELCVAVGDYMDNQGDTYPMSETISPPPLSITLATIPTGTIARPYQANAVASGGTSPYSWSVASGSLPAGLSLSPSGLITGTPTVAGKSSFVLQVTDSSSPTLSTTVDESIQVTSTLSPGYWLVDHLGQVFAFGSAQELGSATTLNPGSVMAIAATPNGEGYWLVSSTGSIEPFGNADALTISGTPNTPVISIASSSDGKGVLVATSGGQVLTAGDAIDYGSPAQSGLKLNGSIVDMTPTPDGKGYWLLGSDGGVFSYGDASFYGSTGSIKLVAPAVAMAPTSDGKGYWFVAADGGIFAYGDATYHGSTYQINPTLSAGGRNSAIPLSAPIIGIVASSDGGGYWMAARDGGVFAFGDSGFVGSLGSDSPGSSITGFVPD